MVLDGPRRTLGLVAAGKAYLDLRQAMVDLGLTEERCLALGIRLYKPAMIWPLKRDSGLTAVTPGTSFSMATASSTVSVPAPP